MFEGAIDGWLTTPLCHLILAGTHVCVTPECLGIKGIIILAALAWWSNQGVSRWLTWSLGAWALARLGLIMLLLGLGCPSIAWWYHDVGAILHFAALSWCFINNNNKD